MHMTVEEITEEALGLPSEARALVADRLAESLVFRYDDREIHTISREQTRTLVDDVSAWAIKFLDQARP